ncbi:MAG: hypothetical protein ABSC73_09075 [Acidimicrobiales bacterium]
MGTHDWFSIIAMECAVWLGLYWWNAQYSGHSQWALIRDAIDGSASLNTPS